MRDGRWETYHCFCWGVCDGMSDGFWVFLYHGSEVKGGVCNFVDREASGDGGSEQDRWKSMKTNWAMATATDLTRTCPFFSALPSELFL